VSWKPYGKSQFIADSPSYAPGFASALQNQTTCPKHANAAFREAVWFNSPYAEFGIRAFSEYSNSRAFLGHDAFSLPEEGWIAAFFGQGLNTGAEGG
jgi:hypothetical protein